MKANRIAVLQRVRRAFPDAGSAPRHDIVVAGRLLREADLREREARMQRQQRRRAAEDRGMRRLILEHMPATVYHGTNVEPSLILSQGLLVEHSRATADRESACALGRATRHGWPAVWTTADRESACGYALGRASQRGGKPVVIAIRGRDAVGFCIAVAHPTLSDFVFSSIPPEYIDSAIEIEA